MRQIGTVEVGAAEVSARQIRSVQVHPKLLSLFYLNLIPTTLPDGKQCVLGVLAYTCRHQFTVNHERPVQNLIFSRIFYEGTQQSHDLDMILIRMFRGQLLERIYAP